ncbi:hypothetical protein [Kribbella sp. CA-293567]|uniref:hypothetical protein n=1 Tax=Kribbella sp. CA-293567 TaxID=3002436 RepID=UPI0022DE52EC|nr:hypothetical protein [Kribbella sp. CA-293567]WBQ02999.1 hypothetical protein OX958_23815 [Kribbella sp. CA-293567]
MTGDQVDQAGRRDRYGEPAPSSASMPAPEHDPACVNGWLSADDEGHPKPCPVCKPWVAACPTCGASRSRCESGRPMRGRCCPSCPHDPPTRKKSRRIKTDQETRP